MKLSIPDPDPGIVIKDTFLDRVRDLISMVDFIRDQYKESFPVILQNIIHIPQSQIEDLSFIRDKEACSRIVSFFYADHKKMNIEREIIGDYTGYESNMELYDTI